MVSFIHLLLYISILVMASMMQAAAFVTIPRGTVRVSIGGTLRTTQDTRDRLRGDPAVSHIKHMVTPDTFWESTLTTAVDVFDGSGIDPVVVSNVFWSKLQANFISMILGQFLAAIVFAFLTSIAASQLSKLGSFVTDNIFSSKKDLSGSRAQTVFQRADAPAVVQPDFGKLLLCIAIDVIGSSSELVPILGEVTDVVWAPIAGLALRSLYGSNVLFALEFTEEILPFTDILPLATLCWVVDTFFSDSGIAKTLGLGQFGQVINGSSKVIDVKATSELDRRSPEESDKRR